MSTQGLTGKCLLVALVVARRSVFNEHYEGTRDEPNSQPYRRTCFMILKIDVEEIVEKSHLFSTLQLSTHRAILPANTRL